MRGRFAPSPTGHLHLGNLRTALVAWLFARSAGSEFVLRFEDLDPVVVRPEFYDSQRRDLERLGLDWDGELRQHEHRERYDAVLDDLEQRGLTYPCFCSRREIREAAAAPHGDLPEGAYPGTCRGLTQAQRAARVADGAPSSIRLRAGDAVCRFVDGLAGPSEGRVDDLILARADGVAAYNLVVVVDDAFQGVEQVVRGDDLLSSTPRQLHLADTLGYPRPAHAHVPLVLGPDRRRLAKRHGAVTLDDRVALGESPRAVLGLLAASLGLAGQGEQPAAAELVARFAPSALPREPWVF